MLVKRSEFKKLVKRLSKPGEYGADTETTGLRRKDRLFSVIVADEKQGYYFNFNQEPDHQGKRPSAEYILPREWIKDLAPIFENEASTFFLHNAKFDMGMLAREGVYILGTIHCTEALERVLKNNYLGKKPYSLASCAARRKLAKDDAVEDYITANGLYRDLKIPGKEKPFREKWFHLVPFEIVAKYGINDAVITRIIGLDQLKRFREMDLAKPVHATAIASLVANERKLTKACFRIEEAGMHINRPYTQGALSYTQEAAASAMQSFKELTGIPWSDDATTIVTAFNKFGIELPKTRTGKPCTNKQVLDELDNPVAEKIREIRTVEKLVSTYYSSFLFFADEEDIIHGSLRQAGAETGRFSHSDPNLANVPKEDEEEDRLKKYLVRGCFTPLNSEWLLVPIDFKQQEFCLTADYAGELTVIQAVMNGEDYHEVVARLMGVPRKAAKTINFGLLYGMGVAKLARALSKALGRLVTIKEASELRADYFAMFPKIREFIRTVMSTAEKRGYIYNWHGFRNNLADPENAYIMPNHLIQGSGAQVVRVAMVLVDEYIRANRLRSHVITQVHDELLFQVHVSEIHHIREFQRIMESVYKPRNGLYLKCSVEHSFKSWAKWDMKKGLPDANAS